jgi:hypothetical protein
MPITSDIGGKNYTLGRGRLFFDRFTSAQVAAGIAAATQGQGERYIGNTPSMNFASSEDSLDHFGSDAGVKIKDDSVSLQFDRTGGFTTDNIDANNLALMFLSDAAGTVTQAAITAASWTTTASPGSFYQVGSSVSVPTGVRNISNVIVNKGAGFSTLVAAAGNYEIDEVLGRIYVLPTSTDIPAGTLIQVTFDGAAGTREQVISKSQAVYGALRFIADNPKGKNRDYYMPYVKLSADGDFNLKGDDWQVMSFTFEVLQKGNLAGVYVDGRPGA